MKERLPWSAIRDEFRGQWVELVDFEWDWDKAFPSWATIRHHSAHRTELMGLVEKSEEAEGSVILYLGATESAIELPESVATL